VVRRLYQASGLRCACESSGRDANYNLNRLLYHLRYLGHDDCSVWDCCKVGSMRGVELHWVNYVCCGNNLHLFQRLVLPVFVVWNVLLPLLVLRKFGAYGRPAEASPLRERGRRKDGRNRSALFSIVNILP
jgi:hypothetical protein